MSTSPENSVFKNGSRRGNEADFGVHNTSASLPRRLRAPTMKRTEVRYVFSDRTNGGPGARDLSRRNAALQIRVGEFQGPFATQRSCGLKSALHAVRCSRGSIMLEITIMSKSRSKIMRTRTMFL